MIFNLQLSISIATITIVFGEWYSFDRRSVAVKDIVFHLKDNSVVSCHVRCKSEAKCISVAFGSIPRMGELVDCFLLKELVTEETDGSQKELFVGKKVL